MPSLAVSQDVSERLGCRVGKRHLRKLDRLARATHRNSSEVVRLLIEVAEIPSEPVVKANLAERS